MILDHPEKLTDEEKRFLLSVAGNALESAILKEKYIPPDIPIDQPNLKLDAATFITLEINGELRGCIGKLDPVQPIAKDVAENTHDAAMRDFRFHPIESSEIKAVTIKISVLSSREDIIADTEKELIKKLVPFHDGLVFTSGNYKSTFLPSVWEKIPDPAEFVSHLKKKAGVQIWQKMKNARYQRYYTVEFSE